MTTLEAIRKHHRVALAIARSIIKQVPPSFPREDLEQAALIGLWDWKTRHPDETEPGWVGGLRVRIRGAVIDELRAQDWLPRRHRESAPQMAIFHLNLDGEGDWIDQLPASEDNVVAKIDSRRAYTEAMAAPVHARDLQVVKMHICRDIEVRAIATQLGIGEPRVVQLRERALSTMRAHLRREARKVIQEKHANRQHRSINGGARTDEAKARPADDARAGRASRVGEAPAATINRAVPRGSGIYPLGTAARAGLCARRAERSAPMTAIVRKPPPSADSCTPPEAAAVSASCVSAETPVSSVLPETGFDMEAELTRYRRWMVDQALVRTQGNRARAAKLLGLNRTTLVEMLKREGTFMRAAGAR